MRLMRPLSQAMNACSKAFFTLLLAGTACATVQAAPATAADITTLFTDALHCRIEFPDGRDEALAQRLRAQGVTVVDRAPGESLDLLYLFATPLEIDGTQVSSITVRGGSGSIVAARATGSLQALVQRTKARPQARSSWDLEGFGELPAQYARAMPLRKGVDETPPRIVIGHVAGEAPDAVRWGCRSYDD
ncbi:hypothetical protein CTI10_002720 [Delftia acidovorans]|uniref:Uncharacterized protein n=1 Tax=Chryseobacterium sp. B5 TaxID=2050562 RepID=A0A2G7TB35_9FLAO|nr:hypothetical protein CTI10_002720 [Delftia acidovorans]